MRQGPTRPTAATPEAVDALGCLERILASDDFDGSPRSRDFVRFVVEETLAGRQDGLSQTAIAARVFGRRADFDPTVDPIVRIQAGRLRRSLERYYLLAGADDPVRIELPRGSYVPILRYAKPAGTSLAGAIGPEPAVDRGGWPSIVLSVQSGGQGEGGSDEAAARFADHLAVEHDRYRDVRVALRHTPSSPSLSKGGVFLLTGAA